MITLKTNSLNFALIIVVFLNTNAIAQNKNEEISITKETKIESFKVCGVNPFHLKNMPISKKILLKSFSVVNQQNKPILNAKVSFSGEKTKLSNINPSYFVFEYVDSFSMEISAKGYQVLKINEKTITNTLKLAEEINFGKLLEGNVNCLFASNNKILPIKNNNPTSEEIIVIGKQNKSKIISCYGFATTNKTNGLIKTIRNKTNTNQSPINTNIQNQKKQIALYPNFTNAGNTIFVNLNNLDSGDKTIALISQDGKYLQTQKVQTIKGDQSIAFTIKNNIMPQMAFVKLMNAKGQWVATEKLIIQ